MVFLVVVFLILFLFYGFEIRKKNLNESQSIKNNSTTSQHRSNNESFIKSFTPSTPRLYYFRILHYQSSNFCTYPKIKSATSTAYQVKTNTNTYTRREWSKCSHVSCFYLSPVQWWHGPYLPRLYVPRLPNQQQQQHQQQQSQIQLPPIVPLRHFWGTRVQEVLVSMMIRQFLDLELPFGCLEILRMIPFQRMHPRARRRTCQRGKRWVCGQN